MQNTRLMRALLLVSIIVSTFKFANCQVITASVVGVVRDPSGDAVAGATISCVNESTGLQRTTKSSPSGDYLISNLPVGRYTLSAEAAGFNKQIVNGLTLQVTQEARVDLNMKVAGVTQQVEVSDVAAVLNTENASIGDVVNSTAIANLPLNVRNFMAFTTLTAGTNESQPSEFRKGFTEKQFAPSAGGMFPDTNEYRLDGIENKEQFFNSYSLAPPVDSVEEFRMQVGQYSAESGGGGAAIVNVITKSGTNQFHGSVYEFLRNNVLDARNFFSAVRPPYRQNQFGASLGGPVIHNKMFFFGNYEGRRIDQGLTATSRVPTSAEAAGDLSSLGKTIIDPQSGSPFPNNIVPANRLDPISQKVLQYYPSPNISNSLAAQNFISNPAQITNQDTGVGRFDYSVSTKDTLFARYGYQTGPFGSPGTFPKVGSLTTVNTINGLAIGETHVFGPTAVNEFRFGTDEDTSNRIPQNIGNPISQDLGLIYSSPTDKRAQGFIESVAIGSSAIAGIGDPASWYRTLANFEWVDTFSWTHGTHDIKFGADIIRTTSDANIGTHSTGDYSFSGTFSKDGFADFLLGDPSSMTLSLTGLSRAYMTRIGAAGFVLDDWKVTPNLTLNIGLRYELQTVPTERNCQLAAFDPTLGGGQGGMLYPACTKLGDFYTSVRPDLLHGTLSGDRNFVSDPTNLAPRFGFAYRPHGSTKTVVRGGYAWYYDEQSVLNVMNNSLSSPPFTEWPVFTSSVSTPQLGWNKLNVPSAASGLIGVPFGLFVSIAPGGKIPTWLTPYTQQWSLSLGQAVTKSLTVRAEYMGSKTTHLADEINYNLAPPSPLPVQSRLTFPTYARILTWQHYGDSNYNGLLLTAEQRLAHGLMFTASYTYSHSLGDTVDLQQDFHPDPNNLRIDYGNNDFDLRHVFTMNYVYDLPVGPKKTIGGNLKGVAGKLSEGWQVAGIVSLHTGFFATPTVPGSALNSGASIVPRAEAVKPGYGELPSSQRSINEWFDPTAFAIPYYQYGNAARNTITMPGLTNWDVSIQKNTSFHENHQLVFRWEMFNVMNTPNFGYAVTDVSSPNLGKIFSAGEPRDMQVSLKYVF